MLDEIHDESNAGRVICQCNMFGIYLKYFLFFFTKKVYKSYVTDTHHILL